MTKKLIPCAGAEPNKLGVVSPIARCRKILEPLPLAKAHGIAVDLEAWCAAREYDERQLEARLAHDH